MYFSVELPYVLRSAIWVVDDDLDDQFLLEVAFKNITPPISIKQLYDGENLLPNLEKTASLPQLVLLDLNMGHQNGFETLAQIREFQNSDTYR